MKFDLAVVGGGIVGIAHALAAVRSGRRVVMIERSERASGASVRNFGLIWPIGQPPGKRHERALRSREIWEEVAREADLFHSPTGSLHLAYHTDEWQVLAEFASSPAATDHGRKVLNAAETTVRFASVRRYGLVGALWSPTEATIDPREAIRKLPAWLEEAHGVQLAFGTTAREIVPPRIVTSRGEIIADHIVVCSGSDLETLYPAQFREAPITRCKLQMLKTLPQPEEWSLGPALCAGLTLTHYDSFRTCPSLPALRERLRATQPFHFAHGIHVLVSSTASGELTIGDSHSYGWAVDPFDREDINEAIMSYLRTFLQAPCLDVGERWHGVYPKMTDGSSELVFTPRPGVTVVNGLGGAGMTLSFGLAEEIIARLG
jgi:FAD dependent oxidoreductase TIGR03364